jgi:hypothetical protein
MVTKHAQYSRIGVRLPRFCHTQDRNSRVTLCCPLVTPLRQRTVNPRVAGSSPAAGALLKSPSGQAVGLFRVWSLAPRFGAFRILLPRYCHRIDTGWPTPSAQGLVADRSRQARIVVAKIATMAPSAICGLGRNAGALFAQLPGTPKPRRSLKPQWREMKRLITLVGKQQRKSTKMRARVYEVSRSVVLGGLVYAIVAMCAAETRRSSVDTETPFSDIGSEIGLLETVADALSEPVFDLKANESQEPGTRLVHRGIWGSDGSRFPWGGLWDTERGEGCSYVGYEKGKFVCLPAYSSILNGYYGDPACNVRVSVKTNIDCSLYSIGEPSLILEQAYPSGCVPVTKVYSFGAIVPPGGLYKLGSDNECVSAGDKYDDITAEGHEFRLVGEPIPISAFVSGELVVGAQAP